MDEKKATVILRENVIVVHFFVVILGIIRILLILEWKSTFPVLRHGITFLCFVCEYLNRSFMSFSAFSIGNSHVFFKTSVHCCVTYLSAVVVLM